MKIIHIHSPTHGHKECLVDDSDYDYLMQWKWYVYKGTSSFYVKRREWCPSLKKQVDIVMHRQILGLSNPKELCDHKNHNGLDNQRHNLRRASHKQNMANRRKPTNGLTSKYIGVSYYNKRAAWYGEIVDNAKKIRLGPFKNEIDAAKARDLVAIKHRGEFAVLNFPVLQNSF